MVDNLIEGVNAMRPYVVVLSGAGISAESGIATFRDADGVWEGHNVMEVASPQGWQANSELVLEFYNQRRRQLLTVVPNEGHHALAELEQVADVVIVTQNVDDLHERAGSSKVIHLHGELLRAQSTKDPDQTYYWDTDIVLGDKCELNSQLRPAIVWFGEQVPMLDVAIAEVLKADMILIVGTSMKVYPAAGLTSFAQPDCKIYYVDPNPNVNDALEANNDLTVIAEKAAIAVPKICREIMHSL